MSGNYTFNNNGDPRSISYFIVRVNAANWDANEVVQRIDQGVAQ